MVVDICARDVCVRVCQENLIKPMKFHLFWSPGGHPKPPNPYKPSGIPFLLVSQSPERSKINGEMDRAVRAGKNYKLY